MTADAPAPVLEHVYIVRISELFEGRRTMKVVAHSSLEAQDRAAAYLDAHGVPFANRITSAKLAKGLCVIVDYAR